MKGCYSTGGLARLLNVSQTSVRKYEQRGWIPEAVRLEGSDRRLFVIEDPEAVRTEVERRRRQSEGVQQTAA